MLLSIKEMELLCIFYDSSVRETLALLRRVEAEGKCPPGRTEDLARLIEKLSQAPEGGRICLEV